MHLETVGEIVRILRARLDLEQVELARGCGWRDASAVSRIETDRIRPTRRTLTKLAQALANPTVTGPFEQIRAHLFRAAGILPVQDEVTAVASELPAIDEWAQPAFIMDFGWYIWRANALAGRMIGLPPGSQGKNYLELFFQPGGQARKTLADGWERAARTTLADFKASTTRQTDRQWYKRLMMRLEDMPDLQRLWEQTDDAERGPVAHRRRTAIDDGIVGFVRLMLTADPRLTLVHVIPEDARTTRALVERGLILI